MKRWLYPRSIVAIHRKVASGRGYAWMAEDVSTSLFDGLGVWFAPYQIACYPANLEDQFGVSVVVGGEIEE